MKIARLLVALAVFISLSGVVIHVGALFGGLSWFIFFNAPPSVIASYKAGTLLAPVSGLVIAGLMAACGHYAASAIGWVRRPPLQSVGLATMATICIVRALLLPVLAVAHPELRNTFEIVAAIVWGLAGAGFAAGFFLVNAGRKRSATVTPLGNTV
jgi:hypothetical protein